MKQSLLLLISSCPRQPPVSSSIYIAELALAAKCNGSGSLSVTKTMRGDSTAAETCLRLSGLQDFKGVFAALTVMGRQFSHTKPLENGVSMASPEPPTAFAVSRLKKDEAAGANKLKINAINKESKKEEKKIQALLNLKLLAMPLAVWKQIVQLS